MKSKFSERLDVDFLEDNCYDKKKMEVVIHYDEDKITELKAEYFELSKQLEEKIELIDEIRDILMAGIQEDEVIKDLIIAVVENSEIDHAGIKSLRKECKSLMTTITKGFSEETRTVFLFEDHEAKKMGMYLEDGSLYGVRDLEKSEMQTIIKPMNKVK